MSERQSEPAKAVRNGRPVGRAVRGGPRASDHAYVRSV